MGLRPDRFIDRNFAVGLGVSLALAGVLGAVTLRLRPRPLVLPPVPVYAGVVVPTEPPAPQRPPPTPPVPVAAAVVPTPAAPTPRARPATPRANRPAARFVAPAAPVDAPATGPGQVAVATTPAPAQAGVGAQIAPLPQPMGPPGAPLPNDAVYSAGDVDRQPEPLEQPAPDYPAWARATGETAVAVAQFVITATGSVIDIRVRVTEGDPRFAAPVRAALGRWQFRPAARQGLPVAVRAEQIFQFELQP